MDDEPRCPRCGLELHGDVKICPHCGAKAPSRSPLPWLIGFFILYLIIPALLMVR
jgi:predicted amidophosphoribosyltransferase